MILKNNNRVHKPNRLEVTNLIDISQHEFERGKNRVAIIPDSGAEEGGKRERTGVMGKKSYGKCEKIGNDN